MTLKTEDGESTSIPFITSGRYFANGLSFDRGENLSIEIIDEQGQLHSASASVPHSIDIDEVEAIESTFGGAGPLGGSETDDIQGKGLSSTTPYNPKGNFENALGYFGVQQTDTQIIVLE